MRLFTPGGLSGGLAFRCLGGPFGKKSLGLFIGDIPLILPGPILGYPPAIYIGLRGGLGLMGGTVGRPAKSFEPFWEHEIRV